MELENELKMPENVSSECEVHLQIQRRGHFQSQSCIGCTTLIWTNNIFYQKNSFVEDSQVLYDCTYL